MNSSETFGYFAKDVASDLEITTSSLRRWSIELEKEGYKFQRNEKDQRIYYERDFKAFRELKKLLSHSVTFADAVKAVISMDLANKNAKLTPSVYEESVRLSKQELQEVVREAVKQAVEEEREAMFQAFEYKLHNVIEQRDRHLTKELHRSLEEKRLEIAASKENIPWWRRLFN